MRPLSNTYFQFLILVGDAPTHGREYNDDPEDSYPNGGPDQLPAALLMEKLKKKQINLMFCRIKRDYTLKMENVLRQCYNDKTGERDLELKTINLYDADTTEARRFHFVFVLDESKSMHGNPWNDLMGAYQHFLDTRKNDQGQEDLVTVIPFSSRPRTECELVKISSAPRRISFNSRGTAFAPALRHSAGAISRTPPNYVPVMIFMSDGGDNSGHSVSAMTDLKTKYGPTGFVAHTVAFGRKAKTELLRQLAHASTYYFFFSVIISFNFFVY